MSQYSAPYPPTPQHQLLAPARRASLMLIVLGSLALVFGMCIGGMAFGVDKEQFRSFINSHPMPSNMENMLPPGMSLADFMMLELRLISIGSVVCGLILLVLGILVRRASKIAIILAMIFCTLLTLLFGVNTVSGLVMGMGSPPALMSACFCLILVGCFGVSITWLSQALRVLPRIEAARHQFQAAYWTSMQQQQSHQQGAYGFGQGGAPPQPPIGYGAIPSTGQNAGSSGTTSQPSRPREITDDFDVPPT